jgi:hypothetical protein
LGSTGGAAARVHAGGRRKSGLQGVAAGGRGRWSPHMPSCRAAALKERNMIPLPKLNHTAVRNWSIERSNPIPHWRGGLGCLATSVQLCGPCGRYRYRCRIKMHQHLAQNSLGVNNQCRRRTAGPRSVRNPPADRNLRRQSIWSKAAADPGALGRGCGPDEGQEGARDHSGGDRSAS